MKVRNCVDCNRPVDFCTCTKPQPSAKSEGFDLRRIYISAYTNLDGQRFYGKFGVDELIAAYNKLQARVSELEAELKDWQRGSDAEAVEGDIARAEANKFREALMRIKEEYDDDLVYGIARQALEETK